MALDVTINLILLCFKQGSTVKNTVIQTEHFHKITHKINQQRLHTVIVDFYSDLKAKNLILILLGATTYSCQVSSVWNWQQGNWMWAAGGVFPRETQDIWLLRCRDLLFCSKGVPSDHLSSNDSMEWIYESHISTGDALKSYSWFLWPFKIDTPAHQRAPFI